MTSLANRVKMTTSTTGTGTITLGSATTGYQSFAAGGIVNGTVVFYVIEDSVDWEIGTGTYTSTGTTMSRTVAESSNADAPLVLSGAAEVYITPTLATFNELARTNAANTFTEPQIIAVSSSSAGLRITQTGAGNALLVEDSASTDTSPFVITAAGDVGIGTTSPDALLTVNTIASFGDGAAATPSIAHKGDLNTGFFFPAADTIAASTAGSERVRITSAGLVGIGTSAPSFPVQVALASATDNLSIGVTETTYTANFRAVYINYFGTSATGTSYGISNANLGVLRFQNVTSALIGTNGTAPLIFATTSLERMRIDASGNVGIGTTSPTAGVKLDVIDSGDAAFNVGSTGTIQSARVRIVARQTSVDDEWNIVATGAGLGSSALRFVKGTWTNTPAAVITSAGNVGIGTTSPDALLTVNTIASFGDGAAATPSIAHKGDLNTGIWFPAADTIAASTAGSERMRIDSAGLVGIATSTSAYKLTVQSTASGAGFERTISRRAGTQTDFHRTSLVYNDSASASGAFPAYAGGIYHEWGGAFGASGGLTFATNNANAGPITFATVDTERMRIDSAGNVGIGTATPTNLLETVNAISGAKISVINFSTGTGDYTGLNFGVTQGAPNFKKAGVFFERTGASGVGKLHLSVNGAADATNADLSTSRLTITSAGNVGIGTTSPTALLDVQSTTAGVRFPNMTTTQKNAIATPQAGTMVFDTTLAKLCVYSGAAWETITSV